MLKARHIVVVGAGYAGLPCALKLGHYAKKNKRRSSGQAARVTLINPEPIQELTCEIYKTLRKGRDYTLRLQDYIKKCGIDFIQARAYEVDSEKKLLTVRGSAKIEIPYDDLIVASGMRAKAPDIQNLDQLMNDHEQFSQKIFSFKNHSQAHSLRTALMKIHWDEQPSVAWKKDFFIVIVGGGSSGIELAGEIAYMRKKNKRARVVLVDSERDLLKDFSAIARRVLKKQLANLGIETVLGSPIQKITASELHIENGQLIPWDYLILATGSAHLEKYLDSLKQAHEERGLKVDAHFQIEGHPNHYAIGDAALIRTSEHPMANKIVVPKRAQFATQEGLYLADHLIQKYIRSAHAANDSFETTELGYLVSLGPMAGIARLGSNAQSGIKKILSPFVYGPIVDQLKKAARLKYIATLEKISRFG